MSEELKQIIDDMLLEESSILAVYSTWDAKSCDGCIFVVIPNKSLEELALFGNKYTDMVKANYGKDCDFEEVNTAVIAIAELLVNNDMECVYRKAV